MEDINDIKQTDFSGIVAHHIPKYLQKQIAELRNQLHRRLGNQSKTNCRRNRKREHDFDFGNSALVNYVFWKTDWKKWQKNKTIFPNLQLIVTRQCKLRTLSWKNGRTYWAGKVDIIQTFPAIEGFLPFKMIIKKKDFYCKPITEFSMNLFLRRA